MSPDNNASNPTQMASKSVLKYTSLMVYRQGFNINKKERVTEKKVFPFLSNLKPVVLLLSLQFNSDTNH